MSSARAAGDELALAQPEHGMVQVTFALAYPPPFSLPPPSCILLPLIAFSLTLHDFVKGEEEDKPMAGQIMDDEVTSASRPDVIAGFLRGTRGTGLFS